MIQSQQYFLQMEVPLLAQQKMAVQNLQDLLTFNYLQVVKPLILPIVSLAIMQDPAMLLMVVIVKTMMEMDFKMRQMRAMQQGRIFYFSSSGSIAAVANINETLAKSTINFKHHGDNTDELDKYVELTVALAIGESDASVASDGTKTQVIKLQDDDSPMQLSFSSSTDENNTEGETETITVFKLNDSTTPAQTNGTTDTEFTMKATIGIGSSDNEANDGITDDDF